MLTPTSSSSQAQSQQSNALGQAQSQVLGKDDFLQLLVTQLNNQDPLNPQEGSEFAAQLAQFTSVEQLTNIQDTLKSNGEMSSLLSQSINSGVAAGLIGKYIEADGNTVMVKEGRNTPLRFELAGAASEVTVTVRDAGGNVVRTIKQSGLDKGTQQIDWDGTNDDGGPLPEGRYTFEVKATDGDGKSVEANTFLNGRVDRVTFTQDGIQLWIGDTSVLMSNVRSVEAGE